MIKTRENHLFSYAIFCCRQINVMHYFLLILSFYDFIKLFCSFIISICFYIPFLRTLSKIAIIYEKKLQNKLESKLLEVRYKPRFPFLQVYCHFEDNRFIKAKIFQSYSWLTLPSLSENASHTVKKNLHSYSEDSVFYVFPIFSHEELICIFHLAMLYEISLPKYSNGIH